MNLGTAQNIFWIKMKIIVTVVILLILHLSNCFAQSGGSFLIYNVDYNKCMSSSLERLSTCDPHSNPQQFRWASKNRILNTFTKKCLGVGSKTVGKKLQWLICEDDNDLQKWECHSDTLLGLKNESLFLAVNDNGVPVISKDTGTKSRWTIQGTLNNICSKPYEEFYTIDGNAFGRPCQFPFLYEKKWYADCTKIDEHNQRLWCSVETDYSVNQLWGYCPTRDNAFWVKHPLTNVYYQVNSGSALTWYQARKSCQQQGAELLSVSEPHEHTFVAGIVQSTSNALWTGLNKLDVTSGWQWSNAQPLRYLKWLSGYPTTQPGYSCGVLKNAFGSEWSNEPCSEKHGYVCQRGHSVPIVPPVVDTGFCHSPWIPYSSNCYLLHRTKKTWLEARDSCLREGGDLLSILSREEQSFVITQLGYSKTDELWIGFNDRKTQMLFEWSDQSSVPFASWEVSEPSHSAVHAEDCVLMRGEEGKWADDICENKYGFICKKKSSSRASNNDTVVTSPGCKTGWTRYGYYCYMAGPESKTFEEAKQMCEKADSQMVDISSRIENAFLVSVVGARPEQYFWIGLSNQKDPHTFEWTNTKKVSFTHFNAGMPGRKQGCVAMTTGIVAGLWDVISCSNKEKYICKQKADGLVTTPAPPTTPAISCPEEWTPLVSRDFCVKHFNVPMSEMKTWDEALDFCQELGGDLLSIQHEADIPWKQGGVYPAWIGYRMYDPSVGFVWSDGSSSSFQSWASDEPNNLNNIENCVEMRISLWDSDGAWNDVNCQDRKDWYCQIRKGKIPKEVNITGQVYNETEDGWILFRGSQYYVSQYTSLSMHDARTFCRKSHADLVVINDEAERVFIWHQAKNSHNEFIIGLTVDLDGTYQWMDGSPVVFQAWEENQPAFKNSEERCVKMTTSQGLWETINCGDEYNFFCKRSGSPTVNSTVAPTQQPKGGCAPEWKHFKGKCYNVKEELKTWTEARGYCRELGGDLASILNKQQQAFLSTIIREKTTDLWIGFSNLANGRFKWTDGSNVQFTEWAKGEPQTYWHSYYWTKYHHSDEQECVFMGKSSSSEFGKWVATDCNSTHGFICSRDVDPGIAPVPTGIPKTFVKLGNSSFKVIQENLTWSEANRRCEAEGAHLASIRDLITQAYLELQVYRAKQPMWIGLSSVQTKGYFLWANNWPMNMEKWASSEPRPNRPCAYMDTDGEWKTTLCNQTYYSVCEQTTDIPPTVPPQHPGHCPQEDDDSPVRWIPYKDSCYAFMMELKSWSRASRLCMTWGASLVSIRDEEEQKFIENNVMLMESFKSFWIGLFQTQKGHWLWSDNTVVDYTNWATGNDYDDDYGDHNWNLDCALLSSKTKKWRQQHCDYSSLSFICKTAKVISTTTKSTEEGPEPHKVNKGLAVFFTIAVVSILGALAFMYYRSSKRQSLHTFENPMYNNRDAAYSDSKDDKTLIANIEIAE
ncbi:macrophage mannose receptor 1 isoform X1 [Carassius gibelio]|uniref:macrophage mannose receptor 1 isoform X1 n=1 Tax=Carassius gibelio TaxID=101364 RepID=UPI0022778A26|nr:macrophage mannose receptor 1 isoform X1 [Carassius gibelio]